MEYIFLPDDSVIHQDDFDQLPEDHSGDYWSYVFKGQELELLDYYLDCENPDEVNTLIAVLVTCDDGDHSFQQALALVLMEFGA